MLSTRTGPLMFARSTARLASTPVTQERKPKYSIVNDPDFEFGSLAEVRIDQWEEMKRRLTGYAISIHPRRNKFESVQAVELVLGNLITGRRVWNPKTDPNLLGWLVTAVRGMFGLGEYESRRHRRNEKRAKKDVAVPVVAHDDLEFEVQSLSDVQPWQWYVIGVQLAKRVKMLVRDTFDGHEVPLHCYCRHIAKLVMEALAKGELQWWPTPDAPNLLYWLCDQAKLLSEKMTPADVEKELLGLPDEPEEIVCYGIS